MEDLLKMILEERTMKLSALSLVLVFVSFLLKRFLVKKIQKNQTIEPLEKVSFSRSIRNYVNLLLIIILIVLWFSQIQAIFVSIVAIAAAIVLATKELIMSLTGGILIKLNHHFKVGDRIEVDGIRGFVIEKSLTVTKVLEIGPDKNSQQTTGDMITIPNSIMLSKSVKNESYFKGYSIKSFNFKLPADLSFDEFEAEVLSWAQEISKDYLKDARKLIGSFCRKEGLLIPTIDPRSKIFFSAKGEIELMLKMPVKNQFIGDIEQDLFRRYITLLEKSPRPSTIG